METHDQRIGWWREARFGMFIHWGVYSTLGGEWQGRQVPGYGEHIQRKEKIPIAIYRAEVAGRFNPTRFDADAWVRAARDAGMGYLIITAKHHDGVAMYDSHVSDYNVVSATPWHHDPMPDLKAACDRYGVKFGFYYSHAFDWGDADGPGNDWEYDNPGGDKLLHGGADWWEHSPELLPKIRRYVDEKSIPQIQELIARYHPAIVWFDTPHKLPPSENLRILEATRAAGPDVVINGRLVRGMGDYANTADRPAEFPPRTGDWEGIPTTNESYGYSKVDRSHKPAAHFIRLLAKAAARGGNLLLNIGPMGDGAIDPADIAILGAIGKWMAVNGEAIHSTERTPLTVQAWGESTRKGAATRLYLHVFDWPDDGNLIVGGLDAPVRAAYLLADPQHTPLVTERVYGQKDLRIVVPRTAPDAVDSVVVIDVEAEPDGTIAVDATARLLSSTQANTLHVFDGQIHGHNLAFGGGKAVDAYVLRWTEPNAFVSWQARLNETTDYDVTIRYDAEPMSAGSTFRLTIGEATVEGKVHEGKQRTLPLGRIHLNASQMLEVRVAPVSIVGPELMRLRSVTLMPAKNVPAFVPAG